MRTRTRRAARLAGRPARRLLGAVALAAAAALHGPAPLGAQADPDSRSRNQPVEPFRIVGNLYYVGASDIAIFLIATDRGLILLDGGYQETAPQIRDNVARLGFKIADVKMLLNSHAHFDHAGGLAQLEAWSGARLLASAGDAPLLAAGGPDFASGPDPHQPRFPPVRADRLVRDGEAVTLGNTTLVAHLTPGHTPGCTTWTTRVAEGGKSYDVVFVCSTTVLPTYRLTDHPTYPGIAADYAHSFAVLAALPCDVFLGSHASFYDGAEKARRLRAGERPNPFVDPQGYRRYVAGAEAAYRERLAAEGAHAPAAAPP